MSFKRRRVIPCSSSSSSPSPESIGYNEGIITEISLYLPVKSILRFRSVSKQWHSLLTHPHFIQLYASHKSTISFLFIKFIHVLESLQLNGNASHNHNLILLDFGYIKNISCQEEYFYLKNSCNGLLLFESNNYGLRSQPLKRFRFYVCNPFTRKYIELDVPHSIASALNPTTNLAFDPSKSPHYKVIFFWTDKHVPCDYSSDYHIAIYSSETRTCRILNHTFQTRGILLFTGTFLNEAIFWVCEPTASSLSYFDINQEAMREYVRPPYSSPGDRVIYIGDCRGRLHLIFCRDDEFRNHRQHVFEVYELKEDYSSWFVKYKVDLDDIAVDFPELILHGNKNSDKKYADPFFISIIEEDEEDPTIVLSTGNKLVAYNLIAKTTRKMCDVERTSIPRMWHETFRCIESLSVV